MIIPIQEINTHRPLSFVERTIVNGASTSSATIKEMDKLNVSYIGIAS